MVTATKKAVKQTIDLRHGDFSSTITEKNADLILTSPPYNIGSSSVAKTGGRRVGQYDSKSYRSIREYADNMPEADYQKSQVAFLEWARDRIKKNGVIVYNHKLRRKNGCILHPMSWIAQAQGLVLVEEIVWDRGSTHNHCPQMMWQQTERLFVLRKPEGKYRLRNTKATGLPQTSDVWRVNKAPVNGHNAPFPLEIAEAAVKAWCPKGGTVIDPYSGSGTTALACMNTGRQFIGSERLKKYFNLSRKRLGGAV